MDKLLYVAMTGAAEIMNAQAAMAHNLANVSTTGFKADYNQFRAMPVVSDALPTRVYAMSERPDINYSAGPLQTTGNSLDMAVKGEGWIAVQDGQGNEAYTRRGDLHLTVNGILETGDGHPVLGSGGPIAIPPSETFEIGSDGTISVRPLGQAANALVQVDRIRLVKPPVDKLQKGEDGLFRVTDPKLKVDADATVQMVSGVLEASNVNPVDAMVSMVELSRAYEMQVKMMQQAQSNDELSAQLMRIQ